MKSKITSRFILAALALSVPLGCTSSTDEDDVDASEEALSSSSVTAFVVRVKSPVSAAAEPPVPNVFYPPGEAKCVPSGVWKVDFTRSRIDGDGCVAGRAGVAARVLSGAEMAKLRSAIKNIRVVPRPQSCPAAPYPGMIDARLELSRSSGRYAYVSKDVSCGATARPVAESSIAGLLTELERLTTPFLVPAGTSVDHTGRFVFGLSGTCVDYYPLGRTENGQPAPPQVESPVRVEVASSRPDFAQVTFGQVGGASRGADWLGSFLPDTPLNVGGSFDTANGSAKLEITGGELRLEAVADHRPFGRSFCSLSVDMN